MVCMDISSNIIEDSHLYKKIKIIFDLCHERAKWLFVF